jgi:hypothetical protein
VSRRPYWSVGISATSGRGFIRRQAICGSLAPAVLRLIRIFNDCQIEIDQRIQRCPLLQRFQGWLAVARID